MLNHIAEKLPNKSNLSYFLFTIKMMNKSSYGGLDLNNYILYSYITQ